MQTAARSCATLAAVAVRGAVRVPRDPDRGRHALQYLGSQPQPRRRRQRAHQPRLARGVRPRIGGRSVSVYIVSPSIRVGTLDRSTSSRRPRLTERARRVDLLAIGRAAVVMVPSPSRCAPVPRTPPFQPRSRTNGAPSRLPAGAARTGRRRSRRRGSSRGCRARLTRRATGTAPSRSGPDLRVRMPAASKIERSRSRSPSTNGAPNVVAASSPKSRRSRSAIAAYPGDDSSRSQTATASRPPGRRTRIISRSPPAGPRRTSGRTGSRQRRSSHPRTAAPPLPPYATRSPARSAGHRQHPVVDIHADHGPRPTDAAHRRPREDPGARRRRGHAGPPAPAQRPPPARPDAGRGPARTAPRRPRPRSG